MNKTFFQRTFIIQKRFKAWIAVGAPRVDFHYPSPGINTFRRTRPNAEDYFVVRLYWMLGIVFMCRDKYSQSEPFLLSSRGNKADFKDSASTCDRQRCAASCAASFTWSCFAFLAKHTHSVPLAVPMTQYVSFSSCDRGNRDTDSVLDTARPFCFTSRLSHFLIFPLRQEEAVLETQGPSKILSTVRTRNRNTIKLRDWGMGLSGYSTVLWFPFRIAHFSYGIEPPSGGEFCWRFLNTCVYISHHRRMRIAEAWLIDLFIRPAYSNIRVRNSWLSLFFIGFLCDNSVKHFSIDFQSRNSTAVYLCFIW